MLIKIKNKGEERKIKLDQNERKIFILDEEEEMAMIKIKESDNIPEDYFLEVDPDYFTKIRDFYLEKNIIFIYFKVNEENIESWLKFSSGKIKKFEKNDGYTLYHDAQSDFGSCGGPIILDSSKKVIGIHIGNDEEDKKTKIGSLLGYVINKINQ